MQGEHSGELEIVAADIGGTHARFAIARIEPDGNIRLDHPVKLKSADHADLPAAWRAYAAITGRPLPRLAALAVAAPLGDELVRFTNLHWTLRPAGLAGELGIDRIVLLNDFGAIAHAVHHLGNAALEQVSGPARPLPPQGVITVVGPGTGLGVACLLRTAQGHHVIETEGGHIGFAPRDAADDAILALLRDRHGRVSAERVVSGSGLAIIREVLARQQGLSPLPGDDVALWRAALRGDDTLGETALHRFCRILGEVAGDLALAHGAHAVVIAGGLGHRLAAHLPHSPFAEGFVDKGRYRGRLENIPVKVLTADEPGLIGAAAAFATAMRDN